MDLMEKGIVLVFIDNPTISTEYIKNLLSIASTHNIVTKIALEGIVKLLLIVELDRAEKEREILIKRIKDGIKASGKKCGRPKGSVFLNEEVQGDIKNYLNDRNINLTDISKKHNIKYRTLHNYVKEVKNQ